MLYKRATFFDLLDLTRGRTIDDVHSDLFIRIFWIIFFLEMFGWWGIIPIVIGTSLPFIMAEKEEKS